SGSVVVNGGILADNGSPITVNVGGNYTQSGGTLQVGLDGSGTGDRFNFTGAANLGGTLGVTIRNGYVPLIGDSFQFLSASSINGRFGQLSAPAQGLRWYPEYQATGVLLLAI